jgi:hypothetical protein
MRALLLEGDDGSSEGTGSSGTLIRRLKMLWRFEKKSVGDSYDRQEKAIDEPECERTALGFGDRTREDAGEDPERDDEPHDFLPGTRSS